MINLLKKDFQIFVKSKPTILITYIVPMLITLIFGAVFGSFGGFSGINEIKVLLVDYDKTEFSKQFTTALDELNEIKIQTKFLEKGDSVSFTTDIMDEWIIKGKYRLGIFIPEGFENDFKQGNQISVQIHYDPKYVIEYGLINGLIQKTIISNFPNIMFETMYSEVDKVLGESIGKRFRFDVDSVINIYFPGFNSKENNLSNISSTSLQSDNNLFKNPIVIEEIKLLGEEEKNPMFVQYVAGMAIMFLLFSVSNAGGSILEERKNGTIKRLLSSPIKPYEILFAKGLFSSLLGLSQLIVLFLFGWIVFKLNIFKDIPALLIMMVATSVACSSLGILLASVLKNQNQINSISTLIILAMSALGGSFFPSFIMPKYIQLIGKFTLNHWAMKGFTDIFWRNLHLKDILPSVFILLSISIILFSIASYFFKKRIYE